MTVADATQIIGDNGRILSVGDQIRFRSSSLDGAEHGGSVAAIVGGLACVSTDEFPYNGNGFVPPPRFGWWLHPTEIFVDGVQFVAGATPKPGEAEALAELKQRRYREIDARTSELIQGGFMFKGVRMSLSLNAQINTLGMAIAADFLTFPMEVNNIDDTEYVVLNSANEASLYFVTAVGAIKAIRDSGTSIKQAILEAPTAQLVEAVKDNR